MPLFDVPIFVDYEFANTTLEVGIKVLYLLNALSCEGRYVKELDLKRDIPRR